MLIGIKISIPTWELARTSPDYHLARSMKNWLNKQGHDTRIDVKEEWYDVHDEVVIVLRGKSSYEKKREQIVCLWNIGCDKPLEDEVRNFDCVFTCRHYRYRSVPTIDLLHGADQDLFYPDNDEDFQHPALFFNEAQEKSIVHDFLPYTSVDIYGEKWPNAICKGRYLSHNILRKHFSGSKVVICEHTPAMVRSGVISPQVFQAAACGAKIITNAKNLDMFEGNVLSYNTQEEIPGLLEKEIDKNRLMEIMQQHTIEKRCRYITNCLETLY